MPTDRGSFIQLNQRAVGFDFFTGEKIPARCDKCQMDLSSVEVRYEKRGYHLGRACACSTYVESEFFDSNIKAQLAKSSLVAYYRKVLFFMREKKDTVDDVKEIILLPTHFDK